LGTAALRHIARSKNVEKALMRDTAQAVPLFDRLVGASKQGGGAVKPSVLAVLRLIAIHTWPAPAPAGRRAFRP
jgi:hypothetical protein